MDFSYVLAMCSKLQRESFLVEGSNAIDFVYHEEICDIGCGPPEHRELLRDEEVCQSFSNLMCFL